MKFARLILLGQSLYYILTGVWPLVHLSSFVAITGPKNDYWLVKMVGLLAASIGLGLLIGRNNIARQTTVLSISAALAFLLIDVYYSFTNVISDIYLVDAAVQLLFIVALGSTFLSGNNG